MTGDCHGNFERFKPEYFPEQAQMTKRDIVICAGDFGGVWFGDSRDDAALDWLESLPFTLTFVCGNHENYDALERYPVEGWHGGKVHRIRPHVLHLMRGQIFELEGYHFFAMGGAKSHDTEDGILKPGAPDFARKLLMLQRKPRARYRINHISWWAQEMPSEAEYTEARRNLAKVDWAIDYVITHCAPTSIALMENRHNEADPLTDFLQEVRRERTIIIGYSAITTITEPLMRSTSCSGSRSYRSSKTGQSREKHGSVTVLFSALSVESGAVRRKGEAMNIRKAVDYSTMFATLEAVMEAELPQMELYCEIGKAVCTRMEKGAAVAAAEFLKEQYPDMTGFSPRNVRRMRDFWQMYGDMPELLGEALHLNWTQNVVIMEAELTAEERRWYIRQAAAQNLSKSELLRMITDSACLESVLDEKVDVWYNKDNDEISERTQYEEDPVYLSWQHLPQPNGRVRDEGLGKEGWADITVSYRIGGHQPGGDRQPGLSSGTAQAGGVWDLLRRPCRTAVDKSGLRRIRSPDRHGPGQPPGYVPHLRRRPCRKDVPPDGPHRSSRQCGGPMVHRGLRGNLAGCAGGLPRTSERIYDRMRCSNGTK